MTPGAETRSRWVVYEERSRWSPWMALVVAVCFGLPAALLLAEGLHALARGGVVPAMGWSVGGLSLLLALGLITWTFGTLVVRLSYDALVVSFGQARWFSRHVPYAEMRSVEAVEYRPLAQFGGWGLRFGGAGRTAWTVRGNRAVRIELANGEVLYVGSTDPEGLVARIRSAAGARRAPGAPPLPEDQPAEDA